jgi:hypothetical protein
MQYPVQQNRNKMAVTSHFLVIHYVTQLSLPPTHKETKRKNKRVVIFVYDGTTQLPSNITCDETSLYFVSQKEGVSGRMCS